MSVVFSGFHKTIHTFSFPFIHEKDSIFVNVNNKLTSAFSLCPLIDDKIIS